MKRYDIDMYSTWSHLKASVVERFLRTYKGMMQQQCHLQGSYNFVENLQNLVDEYNSTWHRTIRMAPKNVNEKNEKLLLHSAYRIKQDEIEPKFRENDIVRISKFKSLFEKGCTANWSNKLFTIASRNDNTNPVTYNLIDAHGEPILGTFYEQELQKARHSDIFLVEKVIKRKGEFVKWLGFNESYNS